MIHVPPLLLLIFIALVFTYKICIYLHENVIKVITVHTHWSFHDFFTWLLWVSLTGPVITGDFKKWPQNAILANCFKITLFIICCLIFFFQINQSGHDRELSLDVDQFCEILSIVLNKGSREEYEDLFNKIDVGKEGYVDWDKFCSHMLLEYYEKDDRMKTTQVIITQGFLNGI